MGRFRPSPPIANWLYIQLRVDRDTNILFYAIDPGDARRHEVAVQVIEQAALEHDCVVPFQAFAEFFAAATRKGKMDPEEAARQIDDW